MGRTAGYKTKQREYILEYLRSCGTRHTTVGEIVRHLQDSGTPVGTATVYRHLEQQAEACHEHFHLKCTCCGKLFHVSCTYLDQLNQHLLEHHGFTVDHTKTVLYGVCADCAGTQEKH